MKIELISNNQIKCFLSKTDLTSREIKVSELAYGTEKAQELFRDMMARANDEYGFEADNVPLMIEAVPLSTDSIMLIITKVDNPDEFEDRFAGLPSTDVKRFTKKAIGSTKKEEKRLTPPKEDSSPTTLKAFLVYKFDELDTVSKIASQLIYYSIDNSSLYRNKEDNYYYLALISAKMTRENIRLVRGIVSEYGEQVVCRKEILSYYDEHFETIVKDKAIPVLVSI